MNGTMVNIDVQTLNFVLGRKSMDMGESHGKNIGHNRKKGTTRGGKVV